MACIAKVWRTAIGCLLLGALAGCVSGAPSERDPFSAVIAMSSKHGMEIALLTRNVCTVMYFDPATIALLRTTLDHAWASLPPRQQAVTNRSVLAERILKAAARGERDPDRLRVQALSERTDLKIAS
jgi:hypothetical protein